MNQNKDVMVANAIIEAIGGKENIRAVGHCSSRLRLTLNDKKVVNEAEIENITGPNGGDYSRKNGKSTKKESS